MNLKITKKKIAYSNYNNKDATIERIFLPYTQSQHTPKYIDIDVSGGADGFYDAHCQPERKQK